VERQLRQEGRGRVPEGWARCKMVVVHTPAAGTRETKVKDPGRPEQVLAAEVLPCFVAPPLWAGRRPPLAGRPLGSRKTAVPQAWGQAHKAVRQPGVAHQPSRPVKASGKKMAPTLSQREADTRSDGEADVVAGEHGHEENAGLDALSVRMTCHERLAREGGNANILKQVAAAGQAHTDHDLWPIMGCAILAVQASIFGTAGPALSHELAGIRWSAMAVHRFGIGIGLLSQSRYYHGLITTKVRCPRKVNACDQRRKTQGEDR